MGARGNSGVILSQILRGLADVVREADGASTAPPWPRRWPRPATGAYGAVMRPVEGTILTVVREAAAGGGGGRRPRAVRPARGARGGPRGAGADALARTPELLPVLAEAGVVDAGGAGLPAAARRRALRSSTAPGARARPRAGERVGHAAGRRRTRRARRRRRGRRGRSALRGHVLPRGRRRDHPGLQGRLGRHRRLDRGRRRRRASGTATSTPTTSAPPSRLRSTPAGPATSGSPTCIEQVEEERWVREAPAGDRRRACPTRDEPVATAVVAVATGDGIRRIFHSLGRAAHRHRGPDR